ncbi:MAG: hypothetical protein KA734_09680 [Fluviicola sp.]|nr:hypothetical protein [Fluviicola sp.]
MKLLFSVLFLFISLLGLTQINSQFVSIKPFYTNNITFQYTGAIQTWTVPAGVFALYIELYGAAGGDANTILGGKGGKVTCYLPVSPGQVLNLTVGGKPTTQTAVYGFGGTGGYSTANASNTSRAGGGLSGISFGTPITQANARAIAAGGGGASFGYSPDPTGGNGGGTTGANGVGGFGSNSQGRGGSPTSGGIAGTPYDTNNTLPTAGSAISGGNGGIVSVSSHNGGAGGGAGYFGGGGGAGGGAAQGGGGGGSSWAHASCANTQHFSGVNSGHGYIIIYY